MRADCGKVVVAVSEDIDPTNTDAVWWSIAYRANPVEDVHIAPHRSSGHGPKSGRRSNDSSMLIDATLKQAFPPLALPKREFMERARTIWEELGLPPIVAAAALARLHARRLVGPWETYARRAVAGDWEQSGRETLARKRGGLTPETPVRDAKRRFRLVTALRAEYRGAARHSGPAEGRNPESRAACERARVLLDSGFALTRAPE